jgi:hypothetical protein
MIDGGERLFFADRSDPFFNRRFIGALQFIEFGDVVFIPALRLAFAKPSNAYCSGEPSLLSSRVTGA